MKKDNELHLTCACNCHELHIEKDNGFNQWYISFWQRGYITEKSWAYRLKCIWHILRTGRPYGDEVVLETADMVELNRYIKHQLDDIKS